MGADRFLLGDEDGIKEWLVIDDATDTITVHRESDVQSAIDENKRLQTLNDGYSPSREWRREASIPLNVIELWKQQYGVDPTAQGNEDLLWRLLNSNEWQHLRNRAKSSRVFWTSPTSAKEVDVAPAGLVEGA